jgi:hypothetical protein
MKFPVFSLLAGNLGDEFAPDCPLQRRVRSELLRYGMDEPIDAGSTQAIRSNVEAIT